MADDDSEEEGSGTKGGDILTEAKLAEMWCVELGGGQLLNVCWIKKLMYIPAPAEEIHSQMMRSHTNDQVKPRAKSRAGATGDVPESDCGKAVKWSQKLGSVF